jgi:outer membrane lipoprotein-sorting protein
VLAVQIPAYAQTESVDAKGYMDKAFAAYAGAKTYQGTWSYVWQQGNIIQKMGIEIKSKRPGRLLYRVFTAEKTKLPTTVQPIPEMTVVADGKTAWFQNLTENTYFKIDLPKDPVSTPLMFMPLMKTSGIVQKGKEVKEGAKMLNVVEAPTESGSIRMEIESDTHHIRRIVSESLIGLTKTVSTIQVEKETFDGEIPDKAFSSKPSKGAKELPAPPGVAQLFGPK